MAQRLLQGTPHSWRAPRRDWAGDRSAFAEEGPRHRIGSPITIFPLAKRSGPPRGDSRVQRVSIFMHAACPRRGGDTALEMREAVWRDAGGQPEYRFPDRAGARTPHARALGEGPHAFSLRDLPRNLPHYGRQRAGRRC
jgi:hypothetical protein